MKRPAGKKQSPPSAPAGKQYMWSIYHIKGTPAAPKLCRHGYPGQTFAEILEPLGALSFREWEYA
jgi:hypothetical protein